MPRVLLDGMAVSGRGRGVSRVLQELLPLVCTQGPDLECVVVTSPEGRQLLGQPPCEMIVTPAVPKSIWEQSGLPWQARRTSSRAIYTHSECGPLWGPSTVLHIPEDPYVRWETTPVTSTKERLRRAYQRLTMERSVRRASVIVTSCQATATQVSARFGESLPRSAIVHLGVDTNKFRPGGEPPSEAYVFHLGSDEPRDQTALVIRAYARARSVCSLPDLVIGGSLGALADVVRKEAAELAVQGSVHLLGRITDEDLVRRYRDAAICVQPAQYEGFGLQPLEALACGAPLLVFDDPAVREVVAGSAEIVELRAEQALADAMCRLWDNPGRRDWLRQQGPRRAAGFPWSSTARHIYDLLTEVAC